MCATLSGDGAPGPLAVNFRGFTGRRVNVAAVSGDRFANVVAGGCSRDDACDDAPYYESGRWRRASWPERRLTVWWVAAGRAGRGVGRLQTLQYSGGSRIVHNCRAHMHEVLGDVRGQVKPPGHLRTLLEVLDHKFLNKRHVRR